MLVSDALTAREVDFPSLATAGVTDRRPFSTDLFARIKRPVERTDWPDSWKGSYHHDVNSVWPGRTELGYRRAYHYRVGRALDAILQHVPAGARVLDLAAAQGNLSIMLAELGYRVTWNDLRDDLIGYVRLKTDRTDIDFLPGDLFGLPPQRVGRFDAILATEIIEHVAHPDAFMRQLASLLSPGGVIVMTTPNGKYIRNPLPRFSDCTDPSLFESVQFKPDADGHIFLLHPDEWVALSAKAGLRLLELDYFINPLSNGHLKTSYLLPLIPGQLVHWIELLTRRLGPRLRQRLHLQTIAVLVPVD
ncbi:MAG: methyltransferase domain-containing protein [Alphaproteobacteria bacterium]|nr:methyltransferase domain-containing protein [Alphaproteobacteria bacterium]